ncbi:helix-turn-helix transcriptional regulator [Kitasatospora sp. RB6PN24]|uniref:Scr1 family TA system antitoxin-like transcriptional regulator n=1 Tax=Kitasatospora humi TaxID=2893891 RepID=UPI001E4AF994|nr:Scr1 family TA system antitoxin-like transcriptional regulator [Kitasatospora humi]MCC9310967.1 helix-turn-helix transcriptional regulator [Kitasatospora humi]
MTFDPDELGRSKQDLAESIRALRKRAGLSGERLARLCNMSQSKISKIETGKIAPGLTDIECILRALDAPPETVSEITALARLASTEWQDKRSSWRRGVVKRQAELAALEAGATRLRFFLPAMITGLLATPEYVRASLTYTPGDTSAAMARKLERQAVLYDESKSFTFILTEQAVKWAAVPAPAMSVQIDRLASLSHLANVNIGVIPYGTVLPRGPMNTFTVYDERLATAESFTGRMVFQDSRDVRQYLDLFALFEQHAVFGQQARSCLEEWSSMYRSDP